MDAALLQRGVLTASAGNFGQGLSFAARAMGVPATVVVPDGAAETKVKALRELGAKVIRRSFDDWWTVLTSRCLRRRRRCLRPSGRRARRAGGQCDDRRGDSGRSAGLRCGGRAFRRRRSGLRHRLGDAAPAPAVRMIVAESEAAQPAAAALRQGGPVTVPHRQSFVDGMGSTTVLAEMWPLLRAVADQAECASFEQIAAAIRLLAGAASRHRGSRRRRVGRRCPRRTGRQGQYCLHRLGW